MSVLISRVSSDTKFQTCFRKPILSGRLPRPGIFTCLLLLRIIAAVES